MNSIQIYDIFILICNEVPIKLLPNLGLISRSHSNTIKTHEFTNNTLLITHEPNLQYVLQNFNFKNLHITFNANAYIDQLQDCHTLKLDNFIELINVEKLKGCHTVYFICATPSFTLNKKIQKLKYCNTICTYCSLITDKCLKKLRHCYKLEFRYPTYHNIINNDDNLLLNMVNFINPFVTDYGVKYLKNCHTVYLNVPYVTTHGLYQLKNCHTLYLNSWYTSNKTIKKLKNVCKIYLFTQYETYEHMQKLENYNVEHYNLI